MFKCALWINTCCCFAVLMLSLNAWTHCKVLLFWCSHVYFDVISQQSSVLCSSFNLSDSSSDECVRTCLTRAVRSWTNSFFRLWSVWSSRAFHRQACSCVRNLMMIIHHIIHSQRRSRYSRRSPPDPSCPAWSAPDTRAETCRNSVNIESPSLLLFDTAKTVKYYLK